MVLYPHSGLGRTIFVLGLIRFNRESIDSRFLQEGEAAAYPWVMAAAAAAAADAMMSEISRTPRPNGLPSLPPKGGPPPPPFSSTGPALPPGVPPLAPVPEPPGPRPPLPVLVNILPGANLGLHV